MSTAIYMPYFYIIQHINSGKYYAGVKFAKNANPDNLLKSNGYQTSSSMVKQLITEDGLQSFLIKKIRVFETADQALDYESRFLRKVNAAFNTSFLNKSNNSINSLNRDPEKLKQSNLEKWGFEYAFQSPEVKEKIRQTNLKKCGCDWVVQSMEFKEKSKQTCLEKYGVEYPNQSPEFKEKYKQTCLEKYGCENVSQSPEIKEKKKQACLDRYGCENPYQSEEVKEKSKQTMLEKYGVEYISQLEEIKEKIKQTSLEKYGFENAAQSPEVKEKSKQTCLEKYGVENVLQSEEIREKGKQTCLKKYGVENIFQSPEIKEKKKLKYAAVLNSPIVLEIKKYVDKFELKLGRNWFWKKEEVLRAILLELKTTYKEEMILNVESK